MQKSWVVFVFSLLFLPAIGQESDISTKAKSFTPNKDVRVQLRVLRCNADVVHGKYTQSFQNKKHLVGEFNLGKRHGKWESYRLDGSLRVQGHYDNGERHGTWTYHSAKGIILATWHYDQGQLEDVLRSHYNNSNNLAMEIAFPEEHKASQAILYFENNRAGAYIEWKYKDTLTAQSSQWYYTNQQLAFFENRLNGKLHGTVSTYHINGVVWENFSYKNNLLIDIVDMRTNTGQPHDFADFALGNALYYATRPMAPCLAKATTKRGCSTTRYYFIRTDKKQDADSTKTTKPMATGFCATKPICPSGKPGWMLMQIRLVFEHSNRKANANTTKALFGGTTNMEHGLVPIPTKKYWQNIRIAMAFMKAITLSIILRVAQPKTKVFFIVDAA